MSMIYELDKSILFFFNETIKNGFFDTFFVFMSDKRSVFYFVPLAALIIYIMYKKNGRPALKKAMTAIIIAGIAVGISDLFAARVVKPIFARSRPCQVLEGLNFWRVRSEIWVITDGISSFRSSFSFYSNHASNSMAAAAALSLFYKKMTAVFIPISLFIGISRMYLGMHYPSDVVTGWIFGAAIGYMMFCLSRRYSGKFLT